MAAAGIPHGTGGPELDTMGNMGHHAALHLRQIRSRSNVEVRSGCQLFREADYSVAVSTRFLPFFFAWYSARSALRRMSSIDLSFALRLATPALSV